MDVCTACGEEHDPGTRCEAAAVAATNPVRWALEHPPSVPGPPESLEGLLDGVLEEELRRERVILTSLVRSIVLRVLVRTVRAVEVRVDGETPPLGTPIRSSD